MATKLSPSPSSSRPLPNPFGEAIDAFLSAGGPRDMVESLDQPTYALPVNVIDVLARELSPRTKTPYLLPDREKIERHFTKLCESFWAIGFWQGQRIVDTPLNRVRIRIPDLDDQACAGWSEEMFQAMRRDTRTLLRKLAPMREQLRGYAGYLLTSQQFLQECNELRQTWQELPGRQRPLFPLGHLVRVDLAEVSFIVFAERLRSFLIRWNLISLATWDLPVPQGPLIPNYLPPGAPAAPKSGVNVSLPIYYRVGRDKGLLEDIEIAQKGDAREKGIDESAAALRNPAAYSRMLDVLHLERSIRFRFPGKPPQGFVTVLVRAMAAHLGCGEDHVRRCRSAITRCLCGKRAAVAMLNRSEKD